MPGWRPQASFVRRILGPAFRFFFNLTGGYTHARIAEDMYRTMATLRLWLAALAEFALERPIKSALSAATAALCVYAAIFDPYGGEDPNSVCPSGRRFFYLARGHGVL